MALIRTKKSWEISESLVTDEADFWNRRTFLRSGKQNTDQETYTTNYVFDGLSNQFTGIAKTFTLQSDGQDVAGFSTNNGVLLINGVFQGPQGAQAITQDYTLGESAGITSVTFTGTAFSFRVSVTLRAYNNNRGFIVFSTLRASLPW